MKPTTKNQKLCARKTRRGRRTGLRRRAGSRACCVARRCDNGGRTCSKVSDKMEALKNLIPAPEGGEIVKPDQLFQQTAEYILRLRTQVVILQKLIEFYGSSERENVAVS